MASVKTEAPAQPAQEQPKAPTAPGTHNLEVLQGMLNLVLLTAGRFIKEHQVGGSDGRMKQGLQRAVPLATERFHDALDELENEVRLAQTVLRRDLALLKQDRKKREAAAKEHEAQRARAAAESRLSVHAKKEEVAVKAESTTPATQAEPPPPVEQPAKVSTPEAVPKVEDESAQPPATDTTAAPPADPLFDEMTNDDLPEQEFDFDFEFGDAMDTSANNNDAGNAMDTSGDMDFNLDEGPSLLRGLEDFANAKGSNDDNSASNNMDIDFSMSDLPDVSTDTKPIVEQPKPAEPVQQPAVPADDTKDSKPVEEPADIKAAVDTNDANNSNDEPMETMTTDNLDDLFNLDDYDQGGGDDSAFNDAFFNFD